MVAAIGEWVRVKAISSTARSMARDGRLVSDVPLRTFRPSIWAGFLGIGARVPHTAKLHLGRAGTLDLRSYDFCIKAHWPRTLDCGLGPAGTRGSGGAVGRSLPRYQMDGDSQEKVATMELQIHQ
jgi:hypothetical protein